MTKIQQIVSEIKAQLKESLTSESTPEEAKRMASLDSKLDEVINESDKMEKEYNDIKDLYIAQVKNTGFKVNGSEDDDIGVTETKGLDDIMIDELNKIEAKQERK